MGSTCNSPRIRHSRVDATEDHWKTQSLIAGLRVRWPNCLIRYRCDAIDTEAVLKVLQPLWTKIPENASRLRGRIENVLDQAKARGFRDGPKSRSMAGALKTLLPARQRLTRGHHAALPYDPSLTSLPLYEAANR